MPSKVYPSGLVGAILRGAHMFEWYLHERRLQAGDYLQRFHLKGGLYWMLSHKSPVPVAGPTLNDKYDFALHMKAHDLSTPYPLAMASNGETITEIRPEGDFIVKPMGGKGGRGIERFERQSEDQFRRATTDELLTYDAIAALYAALSLQEKEAYLFQPRVTNHTDLLPIAGAAAATCRMITILDEQGKPEPVVAIYRMPGSMTGVVDNAHQGGVSASVDITTGRLGLAAYLGDGEDLRFFAQHPASGAQVKGQRLPLWEEVRDLAISAHEAFKPRMLVGWDICITDTGPVIIEGNSAPGSEMLQRAHRKPLGSGRFGQLLHHHLKDTPEDGYEITRELTIRGQVQKVGYRRWASKTAEELGLSGWVRNEADHVRCCLRGPSRAVVEFAERCWSGPERAEVRSVGAMRSDEQIAPGFAISESTKSALPAGRRVLDETEGS